MSICDLSDCGESSIIFISATNSDDLSFSICACSHEHLILQTSQLFPKNFVVNYWIIFGYIPDLCPGNGVLRIR